MGDPSSQRRKRVIFLNRFYWPDESATAQILTDLARHLGQNDFDVHVVTSRLRYESTDGSAPLSSRETADAVQIHRLWSTAFGRSGLAGRLMDYLTIYGSFFLFLLKETRETDVVIVKTDPPLLSILGWIAGLFRPFKLVAWCQDLFPEVAEHAFPHFPGKGLLFGTLKRLRDISLRHCDHVVVISDDMANLVRSLDIRRPIVTIPNWAVQGDTGEGPGYEELRAQWGLSGRIVLGYSGNLGRAHNIETILEALPELVQLERLTLLFIGGGWAYRALQEQAGSYPEAFLRFLPYQPREHLSQTLKVPHIHWFSLQTEMTAHVSPSKFYGILEAGRPVIFLGSTQSSLAASITRQNCGRVVPSGDARRLVGAIQSLYDNPNLCEEMGSNAKELANGPCSRIHRFNQWKEFLQQPGLLDNEDTR